MVEGISGQRRARFEVLREFVPDLRPGDQVLVTNPTDVRWLCGFTGSHGWLVVDSHGQCVFTDGRYTDQVRLEAGDLEVEVVTLAQGETMGDLLERRMAGSLGSPRRVFFHPNSLSVAEFEALRAKATAEYVPLPKDYAHLRRGKDAAEIEVISRAARIADEALAACIDMLSSHPQERDVRDELEYTMRRLGADAPSYDTIVASGPVNSAKPHHRPGSTRIEDGHSLVIDVGALVDGYHSDMTRSFLVGDVSSELREAYDIVRLAQQTGLDLIGPGVPCVEIDRACRRVLDDHGLADYFVHGTGHGVGLDIHEEPFIGASSSAVLRVGDVVTVEPGVYRMGLGGLRIEDLVVVTDTGSRCLTAFPKDSPCLPSPRTI